MLCDLCRGHFIGERLVRIVELQRIAAHRRVELITDEAIVDGCRIFGNGQRLREMHFDALADVDRVRDGQRRGTAGDVRLGHLFIDAVSAELPLAVAPEIGNPVTLGDDHDVRLLIVIGVRQRQLLNVRIAVSIIVQVETTDLGNRGARQPVTHAIGIRRAIGGRDFKQRRLPVGFKGVDLFDDGRRLSRRGRRNLVQLAIAVADDQGALVFRVITRAQAAALQRDCRVEPVGAALKHRPHDDVIERVGRRLIFSDGVLRFGVRQRRRGVNAEGVQDRHQQQRFVFAIAEAPREDDRRLIRQM